MRTLQDNNMELDEIIELKKNVAFIKRFRLGRDKRTDIKRIMLQNLTIIKREAAKERESMHMILWLQILYQDFYQYVDNLEKAVAAETDDEELQARE